MSADTIFLGGAVLTVSSSGPPRAEALAIRDGRILAAGTAAELAALRGPHTRILDLEGGALLPGFVEPHGHPFMMARARDGVVDVSPFTTPAAAGVWQKLRAAAAAARPGAFILARGVDPLLHHGLRLPAMAELDRMAPQNPLMIITNNGHAAYANRHAFALAGVTRDTPDPHGARYIRDAAGELTGAMEEGGAIRAVSAAAFAADDGVRLAAALRQTFDGMAAAGITTTSDQGCSGKMFDIYRQVAAQPGTPVRVRAYEAQRDGAAATMPPGAGTPMFRQIGVKFIADGSPWVGNIANSRPYRDTPLTREAMGLPPGHRGPLNYEDDWLAGAVTAYHARGYQVSIHSHGDRAQDQALDAFARALAAHPRADHRLRLEHCGIITDAQLARAARMGVTLSFFPTHVYYWGDVLPEMFDAEVAERWCAAGSAARAGVRFTLHNDCPVTPPWPLLNIQAAVTRRSRGGRVLGEDQRISLDRAIRACTLDAAFQLFMDDEHGSLDPGKRADLVWLATDPTAVEPDAISAIPVRATFLDGVAVMGAGTTSER